MFTQNCFLRNTDFRMATTVMILGYEMAYKGNILNNVEGKNLVCEYGTWHFTDSDNHPNCIDCGENPTLFMLLCNMRDDTDEYQLFMIDDYMGGDNAIKSIVGTIQCCNLKSAAEYFPHDVKYHRATADEIIDKVNQILNNN